jgi:hypothetical protein
MTVLAAISGIPLGLLLGLFVQRLQYRVGYGRGLLAGRTHAAQDQAEPTRRVWSLADRAAAFNEPGVGTRRRSPDHRLVARVFTCTNERPPLPR